MSAPSTTTVVKGRRTNVANCLCGSRGAGGIVLQMNLASGSVHRWVFCGDCVEIILSAVAGTAPFIELGEGHGPHGERTVGTGVGFWRETDESYALAAMARRRK